MTSKNFINENNEINIQILTYYPNKILELIKEDIDDVVKDK